MKEMDCVEIIVEKEKYAEDGVHKGMYGWICHDECCNGWWLVDFPQLGEKDDIAIISVKEDDMELVPVMYAAANELIKDRFDGIESETINIDFEGADTLKAFYKRIQNAFDLPDFYEKSIDGLQVWLYHRYDSNTTLVLRGLELVPRELEQEKQRLMGLFQALHQDDGVVIELIE